MCVCVCVCVCVCKCVNMLFLIHYISCMILNSFN